MIDTSRWEGKAHRPAQAPSPDLQRFEILGIFRSRDFQNSPFSETVQSKEH